MTQPRRAPALLLLSVLWLLAGPGVAPSRADPLGDSLQDLWQVETGASTLVRGCEIPARSWTGFFRAQELPLWNYYTEADLRAGRLTARRVANYPPASEWGDNAPPQAVVDQINALGQELTFSGQVSADGRRISGVDSDWCYTWQGATLTDQRPMSVPIGASRIDTAMVARDGAAATIEAIALDSGFTLEVSLSLPITWSRLWIARIDGEAPLWIAAEATDDPLVFRTAPITVAAAPAAALDLAAEATAGRFYAAAGSLLRFAVMEKLAVLDLAVTGGETLRLSNPRIDDLDLRVARGSLDADIGDLERRIALEQGQIERQNRALEALAEAARTKDADIQGLEAQLLALTAQRDALAIDRAALPDELRTLLAHRDNLRHEKRLAEDRLLAAHDRGDAVGRDFEVRLLESLERQIAEANQRIRALWAEVAESADDLRPTTPQQLERARKALQQQIDALHPRIAEARARRGFDEISTQVAREAIVAAETAIAGFEQRLEALRRDRARLDRPFGYVQFIRATQHDLTAYEATHEDLARLVETFEDVKRRLAEARRSLFEAEQLHWRLKQAFLAAAEEVAAADRAVLSANWASLAKQFGVEVVAAGSELGFAFLTGGPPGLLIEATSKVAFNLWDIYQGQEPIQNFDASGLAALVAKQRENDEKQYDADALLDDDSLCRYAAAAGAEAQRLASLEPDLFPSGALFDRYGWPILRESLSMGLKNPATYAAQHKGIQDRINRGLADLDELRRMRANPVPWMDSMDPNWRDKVDFDRVLAAERKAVEGAIDELTSLSSWRRQAAQAGLGVLLSVAVNVGKQAASEWIRSTEGEAYVAFFEQQLAMTQAWRAYMGSSCLKWKEQDRVERLRLHYDALLKAYDLELGFVIATDKPIDSAAELLVAVPLSQGGGYPLDLEIAGVTGERLGEYRFRFPAGSLAEAPRDRPLPVVVKLRAPPP